MDQKNSDQQLTDGVIFLGQSDEQLMPIIGSCLHEIFEFIALNRADGMPDTKKYSEAWRVRLLQLGVTAHRLDDALNLVIEAVDSFNCSSITNWLFSSKHMHVENEWPLSHRLKNGELKNYIIDRSFIDADDTRWIIDYKTTQQGDSSVDELLALKKSQYTEQLQNYYRAVETFDRQSNTDVVKTQCALYLPLLDELVLIDAPSS